MVQGVREMCDVCETSLFNYHWACSKCGFVVCIDCYKARKYGENKVWNNERNSGYDRDEFQWFLCTNRAIHDQERLMLTQIIAGDSLKALAHCIHQVRAIWKIPQNCCCLMSHEKYSSENYDMYKNSIQSILNESKFHFTHVFSSTLDSETKVTHEVDNPSVNDESDSKFKQNEETSEQNDDSSDDG